MARAQHNPAIQYGHDSSHEHVEGKKNFTFLIVIVSLLFVAVFGGALVGGVVSGDPSNAFFFTIIGASALAISVAAFVSVRYYIKADYHEHDIEGYGKDVRGTFTRSEDEVEDDDAEEEYYGEAYHKRYAHTPVDARIKEVRAKNMPGDVSALSPTTYEAESYASRNEYTQDTRDYHDHRGNRNHTSRKGLFDFASVASSRPPPKRREDPPEDSGPAMYEPQQSRSKDPSAIKLTASGEYEESEVGLNPIDSQSYVSATSRYDTPYDDDESAMRSSKEPEAEVQMTPKEEPKQKERKRGRSPLLSRIRSRSRSKSPAAPKSPASSIGPTRSRSKSPSREIETDKSESKRQSEQVAPPPPPPPPPQTERAEKRVRSTKSGVPATPVASEAGSSASSMFLKPFTGFFGKKKAVSEAGYSDASAYVKGLGSEISGYNTHHRKGSSGAASEIIMPTEGRPPMGTKRISFDQKNRGGLETIGGGPSDDKYTPSNLAKTGIFSMPSPKPIPSTPGSESRISMAESSVFSNGVASSTFNPQSRERALKRMARNTASLGANFNDMPIFYEDDDEENLPPPPPPPPAQAAVTYDVFAPSGPIGIVVDTIAKGCIVHSLKKTSPMQGLINPGDLIVALDDIDVRKMDAAALTKLMAKKSQQKERKFTLISAEDY